MKEQELRESAICGFCQKKIGQASRPIFYRVRLERYMLNPGAIERQMGLTALLGGSALLAQVMGTDEDMATSIMEPELFTVCDDCSIEKRYCIAAMAELATPVKRETT
jgi:hypothetical protein